MGIMLTPQIREFIRINFKKRKVLCLTGAGISAESGIPTFRGKGGLWEKYDPAIYANTEGLLGVLRRKPKKLIEFLLDFYTILLKAVPNAGHKVLAELGNRGILRAIITQNIDNLHYEAGSTEVVELHGNALRLRCMHCQAGCLLGRERIREMLDSLRKASDSYPGVLRVLSRYFGRCRCGGRYRIDIVLFGEMLPEQELLRSYQLLDDCDVLLVIGSSLVVYPAAALPLYAKEKGAKLIEINNQPEDASGICDYTIKSRASDVLPEILSVVCN